MAETDIARLRLDHQRLTRRDLATPAEVTRWLGAVQAQEYAWSLYALGLRMPNATQGEIERAIAERSIVRTWPMRGTIHLVPAEDARWMVALLARRTNRTAASVYRRAGLTGDDFARAGDILAKTLRGGVVMSRRRLYAALEAAGLATRATQGEPRGVHLLGYWAREGLICLGPRAGQQPTFTLLDEWAPNARRLDGDAALALLATRYFTSHGPATPQDFAWWAGLTITEARQGVTLVEQTLPTGLVIGDGRAPAASAPTRHAPAEPRDGGEYLLPPYDEFTVAYADRSAMLSDGAPTDPFMLLGPTMVVDGRVVGVWKRRLTRDAAYVTLTPFAPLDRERQVAFERAAAQYGAFIGLPVVIA